MNLSNYILTKIAIISVLFCIAAAIDFPNNPARYLVQAFCQSINR